MTGLNAKLSCFGVTLLKLATVSRFRRSARRAHRSDMFTPQSQTTRRWPNKCFVDTFASE